MCIDTGICFFKVYSKARQNDMHRWTYFKATTTTTIVPEWVPFSKLVSSSFLQFCMCLVLVINDYTGSVESNKEGLDFPNVCLHLETILFLDILFFLNNVRRQ